MQWGSTNDASTVTTVQYDEERMGSIFSDIHPLTKYWVSWPENSGIIRRVSQCQDAS